MLFMRTYQVDGDKQADTQPYLANMSQEQIDGEYPNEVKQIGRWHDMPNGRGQAVIEADSQEALTSWMMGWSGQATFPIVAPVMDDTNSRKLVKGMLDSQ